MSGPLGGAYKYVINALVSQLVITHIIAMPITNGKPAFLMTSMDYVASI